LVELINLASHQVPDMGARTPPVALYGDDFLDLLKREAEALCLADERDDVQCVGSVDAIAGRRPPCGWQNAGALVKS
jgi:hypothetical protein